MQLPPHFWGDCSVPLLFHIFTVVIVWLQAGDYAPMYIRVFSITIGQ